MRHRWVILGVMLLGVLIAPTRLFAQPIAQQTLNCAVYTQAGAIECDVSESWISPGTFPRPSSQTWPPEGYTLIQRGLLSNTATGEFCVVFVRSLQRIGAPNFGETHAALPWLHEGFDECPPGERLGPNAAEYGAVVKKIREVLPRPTVSVQPGNNTLVGIQTLLDMPARQLSIDTQTTLELTTGPKYVRIQAQGAFYVRWRDADAMTGPYLSSGQPSPTPAFQYDTSEDMAIDVVDVWSVEVSANGLPTFRDIVYVGYPPLALQVNELVISVVRLDE